MHLKHDTKAAKDFKSSFDPIQEKKFKVLIDLDMHKIAETSHRSQLAELQEELLNEINKLKGENKEIKLGIEQIQLELNKKSEDLKILSKIKNQMEPLEPVILRTQHQKGMIKIVVIYSNLKSGNSSSICRPYLLVISKNNMSF